MRIKVSLIVPVYELAGGKLEFCLDSLLAQTLREPYEILAVDDRSGDNSFEVLQSYAARASLTNPMVTLTALQNPVHAMQGAAKNLGLSRARGEWIGFIDGDDWVTPDYLERLLSLAEREQADLVGCDLQLTHEQSFSPGQRIPSNDPSQAGDLNHEKYASLILDSGSLCTKLYRRELILDHPNRFPEGILYEDNAISNSWMLRAKRFAYLPEALYFYYQHASSTVHRVSKERCGYRMEAGRLMLKEAHEFGFFDEYRPELETSFSMLFYVNTLFSYVRGVAHPEEAFVRSLGEEMLRTFPDFQENPGFIARTTEEERRLISMQLADTRRFLRYDRWLQRRRRLARLLRGN